MNSGGEDFADVLDRELAARGHGSMEALSVELEGRCDLTGRQIYRCLADWRREPGSALRFDLACQVVVALPGLLEAVAARAGCLVVRRPALAGGVTELVSALADYQQDQAESVSLVLEAVRAGHLSREALVQVERELSEDEGRIAVVRETVRGMVV